MILRLIILALAIWFGFRIYHSIKKPSSPSQLESTTHDMVSCTKCGIHIPKDEAVVRDSKYYCSQDHLPKIN